MSKFGECEEDGTCNCVHVFYDEWDDINIICGKTKQTGRNGYGWPLGVNEQFGCVTCEFFERK
jgi:hypothetical protein